MTSLTPDQVADDLGIHRDTVLRLMRRGELPAFRVGRYWRADPSVLDEWKRRPVVTDSHGIEPASNRSRAATGRKRTA